MRFRFRHSLAIAALALLSGLGALQTSAQTLTTVTGTVTDARGVPYGGATLVTTLTSPGGATPSLTPCNNPQSGCQIQGPGPVALDATGSFRLNIWANASILPAGTTYDFKIILSPGVLPPWGTGPQVVDLPNQTIAGSAVSLTTAFAALPPPPLTQALGSGSGISGSGSIGYLPIFTAPQVIANSPCLVASSVLQCATSISATTNAFMISKTNSASGTTQYLAVTLDASGNAITASTTQVNNILGIAGPGAGTSGVTQVAIGGDYPWTCDNQTTVLDWLVASTTVNGECHDAGPTEPTGVQNIGRVAIANSGAGTTTSADLFTPDVNGGNATGTAINVNGTPIAGTTGNFNSTTPAAGSGYENLPLQRDTGTPTTNISVEAPLASTTAPGLIQLSTDLCGSYGGVLVCGLQGNPLTITSLQAGQVICANGSTSFANCSQGIVNNPQTASYPVVASDCGKRLIFDGSTAVAVTLPTAATLGNSACTIRIVNNTTGAGTVVTVAPTTWTIGPGAQPSFPITQGTWCTLTVDGTNWDTDCSPPGSGLFYANTFPGTPDAQVASCFAAAKAATGICDTRGLNGLVVMPTTSGLVAGDTAGDPFSIIWPGDGSHWQFPNLTGGTNCMFTQYMGVAASGIGVSENAFIMELTSVSGGALCGAQVLNGTATNGYWRNDGIYFQQHGGGVASGIFVNIGAGEDNSGMHHFAIFDSSTTDTNVVALTATGSTAGFCCGATLSDGLIDGNYVGGIPLAVYGITGGKQPNGFNIHNVQMQHPRPGLPSFFCQDTSTQPKVDVTFSGSVYLEASQDTTTAIMQNDGCRRISMPGGMVIHAEAASTAKTVFTSTNRFNTLWEIGPVSLISGLGNWVLPATIVNNASTGDVLLSDSNGFFSGYTNSLSYMSSLQLGGTGGANLTFQTTTPSASILMHGYDPSGGSGASRLDFSPIPLTNEPATLGLFRQTNSGTANAVLSIYNGDGTSGVNSQLAGANGSTFFNVNNAGSVGFGTTTCGGLGFVCIGAGYPFIVTSTGQVIEYSSLVQNGAVANEQTKLATADNGSGGTIATLDVIPSATNNPAILKFGRNTNTGTANFTVDIMNGDGSNNINSQLAGSIGNTYFGANNTTGSISFGTTTCGGLYQVCGSNWGFTSGGAETTVTVKATTSMAVGSSPNMTGVVGTDTSFASAGNVSASTNVTCTDANSGFASGTANCGTPAYFMTFYLQGSPGGTATYDTYPLLNRAINIDSATLYFQTAPVGCSTYATLELLDVTGSVNVASVPLTNGTVQYNMTINSAAVPISHALAMRTSVAEAGCSTNASAGYMMVQYH